MITEGRRSLRERGVVILPGFVRPDALEPMVTTTEALRPRAFLEDVAVGMPYLELSDASFPEGHPRRTPIRSTTWVMAYDLVPKASPVRALYECAPFIRSETDERYDDVARVLALEERGRVQVFPMVPGTLMIFQGRHSLHRVTPVEGERPRFVALFGFDTKPGSRSSDLLKRVRYGRTEPIGAES